VFSHQGVALCFQALARFNQLFPLPMDGTQLLLFFSGHAHQGQRILGALDKSVQLQAERLGIQPIGLYPPISLIQLLRAHDVAVDPQARELALQAKTKPARFIDGVYFSSLALHLRRPVQERFFRIYPSAPTRKLNPMPSPFKLAAAVGGANNFIPRVLDDIRELEAKWKLL
jgi:hypothetical protein